MSDLDRRVARQGGRHHRIVSGRQLSVIGLDKSAISRRVSEGRLTQLHRGVYLVGPPPPSVRGKWLAAVIACGDGAVLSHRHGAMRWDMRRTDSASIDVTAPGSARRRHDGITVHRTRAFHPDDITVIDHIPVTSAERTLLDLAEILPPHQLQRAYEQAEKLRIIDHAKLRAWSSAISETSLWKATRHRSTPTGPTHGSSSSCRVTSITPARRRSSATTRSARG